MTNGDLLPHFRAARRRVVKWTHYLAIYEHLLSQYRGRALTLVEVGVVEDTHTADMPKQYPAAGRFGFMQFAQHVVDVLHVRNELVTEPAADTAGLGW